MRKNTTGIEFHVVAVGCNAILLFYWSVSFNDFHLPGKQGHRQNSLHQRADHRVNLAVESAGRLAVFAVLTP